MQRNHANLALFSSVAVTILVFTAGTVIQPAFAHQRQQLYTIGDQDYLMIVGSLNEPIFVDDKSGFDFRVLTPDPSDPMNSQAEGAIPVEGLENTLKVENWPLVNRAFEIQIANIRNADNIEKIAFRILQKKKQIENARNMEAIETLYTELEALEWLQRQVVRHIA